MKEMIIIIFNPCPSVTGVLLIYMFNQCICFVLAECPSPLQRNRPWIPFQPTRNSHESICPFENSTAFGASTAPNDAVRHMAGCTRPRKAQWLACDACGRWCHILCVNFAGSTDNDFVCPVCLANYA